MYSWLGIIFSTLGSTLALGAWFVMAVPYFDNAPYLTELRHNSKIAYVLGVLMFGIFFVIFYLSALYLDTDTSGPLLAFTAFIIALPVSMLIGTETWEHYHPKGINRVPAIQAVAISTGIGLAEMGGAVVIFMLLFRMA
jgi:hypothetical protein